MEVIAASVHVSTTCTTAGYLATTVSTQMHNALAAAVPTGLAAVPTGLAGIPAGLAAVPPRARTKEIGDATSATITRSAVSDHGGFDVSGPW